MILGFFLRDVFRDTGLAIEIWNKLCARKRKLDIAHRGMVLMDRFKLTHLNLFSEMLAVLIIPLMVLLDWIGIGKQTITIGFSLDDAFNLVFMYGVLLLVELGSHVIIRRILTYQVSLLFATFRVCVRVCVGVALFPSHTKRIMYTASIGYVVSTVCASSIGSNDSQ